jgi:transposase
MRCRYRIEPTPTQRKMLARVFGCCRVVFNDALRVRDDAYHAGIKLSDSEIQRRVITAAKTTVERGWLASSKTCSACGHRLDELPLQIRTWRCPSFGAVHDRDHNAAKVILAAGRAERLNASHESGRDHASGSGRAPIRPPSGRRGVDEAGSTPSAA